MLRAQHPALSTPRPAPPLSSAPSPAIPQLPGRAPHPSGLARRGPTPKRLSALWAQPPRSAPLPRRPPPSPGRRSGPRRPGHPPRAAAPARLTAPPASHWPDATPLERRRRSFSTTRRAGFVRSLPIGGACGGRGRLRASSDVSVRARSPEGGARPVTCPEAGGARHAGDATWERRARTPRRS